MEVKPPLLLRAVQSMDERQPLSQGYSRAWHQTSGEYVTEYAAYNLEDQHIRAVREKLLARDREDACAVSIRLF